MSNPDRDGSRQRAAAERLSGILHDHGIGSPGRLTWHSVVFGFLAGTAIGLIIGWLIWA